MVARLEVEFCGEVRSLAGDDTLVFGRGAELDIDSNPRLHRRLGHLRSGDGWWWLSNVGRSISMRVVAPSSGASHQLPAGTHMALTHRVMFVGFDAGGAHYELTLTQPELSDPAPAERPEGGDRTMTVEHQLPLNVEQRQLLALLCESRLRDPAAVLTLPTNDSIAQRLGWSRSKFNNKLDWLCLRYARAGVPGLQKSSGRAVDRRRALAEWVLANGLVSVEDLASVESARG